MRTIPSILAGLPVPFKGATLSRIGGRLFGHPSREDLIFSNLGIDSHYRMTVPAENSLFAFGNPMAYYGERGVLYLSSLLGKHVDAVADIGANWGYYTFFMRHFLTEGKPIFFFEPNEKLFDAIRQNIISNNLVNIHGIKKGIAAVSGKASFFVNLTNDLSSTLDKGFVRTTDELVEKTIEIISFDDFVEQNKDFNKWLVKVDIENTESDFIKGAAKHMDSVEFLLIEFLEKARKEKLADLLTQQFGLNAYYINDFTLEFMDHEDGRYAPGEYNFLFCRHTPEALSSLVGGSRFTVVY
ncbi:MAG: FkbM family methyltransferase [Saprospiraceae bacterium]